METMETPPTFNPTNKFTQVFQDIVDSYGIASYREINPAPFTIITFPFLFAVMFGDFGHGLIMTLAGFAFIYYEKIIYNLKIKDEIFNTFFGGRFIIILMGLFSMYTGVIYNDLFAKSVNLFGSKWSSPLNSSDLLNMKSGFIRLDPADSFQHDMGPYLIGIDPIWNVAENRLNFLNSMKMKASVIIGIAQMMLGVILGFLNASFFGSAVDIITQSIPQFIFLSTIFVYLCGQIFTKWLVYWVEPADVFGYYYPGSHCAPSLLVGLISMFMFRKRNKGFVNDVDLKPHKHCHLSHWYPYQDVVEKILVCTAMLCVPVMLFGKPLCRLLIKKKPPIPVHNRRSANISVRVRLGSAEEAQLIAEENGEPKPVHRKGRQKSEAHSIARSEHEPSRFSDLMVHQSIHTIEFVLGCISHTASYLRLWALSLAHSQLSEVLWHMILARALNRSDTWAPVVLFLCFGAFFILTVSVLVIMEGLSAFLHALRLHWVEFQSKFYEGAGHQFLPLNFKKSLVKLSAESAYL